VLKFPHPDPVWSEFSAENHCTLILYFPEALHGNVQEGVSNGRQSALSREMLKFILNLMNPVFVLNPFSGKRNLK